MTTTTEITTPNNLDNPIFHIGDDGYRASNDTDQIDKSIPLLTCKVEISPGVYLYGAACREHVWIDPKPLNTGYLARVGNDWRNQRQIIEVDPFFTAEGIGQAYHRKIQKRVNDDRYGYGYGYALDRTKVIEDFDTYGDYDYHLRRANPGKPYNYLKVKLTFMGKSEEHLFKFEQPEAGEVDIDANNSATHVININTEFFGLRSTYLWDLKRYNNRYPWYDIWSKLVTCTFKQGVNPFLIHVFGLFATNDGRGLKSTEKRKEIKPILDRLQREEPLLWSFYSFLKNGKTVKKMSNNRLLAAVLLDCGKNYKKFKSQLETVLRDTLDTQPYTHHDLYDATRAMCMRFPLAQKTDAKARAKAEWNMREGLSAQAQGLGIHPRRHKNLMKAITKNQIALSIFHTTGDPLNLINVEFDLWEKALRRKGWAEVIVNICNAVTNKNRFEKHITPYLSFLFRIERYLKRHTGRNWTAFPKLVNSEAQLEMQERDENGTVKTRSALTPIADNENNTITVPYAGLKMYGAQTTYCYSKHYFVFERDTIDQVNGSVIVNELERKLNGRDDYGLMYYTLDGSVEAQGYPTFLIIFERRSGKKLDENWTVNKPYTFVHFHRVHPSRKKDGRMVPSSRLIEECYRYMAGNVRANEIFAQQGDLIFIKSTTQDLNPEDSKGVVEFESHQFHSENEPVKFWENTAKSIKNRLGFIATETGFTLRHPEHEWVDFEPGVYEVRRCRSWEANPSSVWSYTFD